MTVKRVLLNVIDQTSRCKNLGTLLLKVEGINLRFVLFAVLSIDERETTILSTRQYFRFITYKFI